MAGVIASSFATILTKCREQVVSATKVDDAQVDIVMDGDPPKLNGDRDALLRPLSYHSTQEAFDGAGRTCCELVRFLDVIVRTRSYMDKIGSGVTILTDAEYGLIPWEELVAKSLAGYSPEDDDENLLVTQPIRIFDGPAPEKDRIAKEWGGSGIRFEVKYLLLLHQAEIE